MPPVACLLSPWNEAPEWNFVFICAACILGFLPLVAVFWHFRNEAPDNLFALSREKRLIPFLINFCAMLLFAGMLYGKGLIPSVWTNLLVILATLNFFALIITFFWKISLHLMGLGCMAGICLAQENYPALIAFALLALPLGWARFQLKSHDLSQLAAGFFSGFLLALWIRIA